MVNEARRETIWPVLNNLRCSEPLLSENKLQWKRSHVASTRLQSAPRLSFVRPSGSPTAFTAPQAVIIIQAQIRSGGSSLSAVVFQNAGFAYKFVSDAQLTYSAGGSGKFVLYSLTYQGHVYCIGLGKGSGKAALAALQYDFCGTDSPFSSQQLALAPDLQVCPFLQETVNKTGS
jgi:hypothetical protein